MSRHISDTENKLLILYTLNAVGPASAAQLLQILADNGLMNYFDMQLNLSELLEEKQVAEQQHPLAPLLYVTEEGQYSLSSFFYKVPASRRDRIDATAPEWQSRFRLEQGALAECFSLSSGARCVRLRLLEGTGILMDLMLVLEAGPYIPGLDQRWQEAASRIYAFISADLAKDYGAAVSSDEFPPYASVHQSAPDEWQLFLADQPENPRMTLLLPCPDLSYASACAMQWGQSQGAIRNYVLETLKIS